MKAIIVRDEEGYPVEVRYVSEALDELRERANANVEKWGPQDFQTLALAVAEEAGELAQAVLKHRWEDGPRERIRDEAVDLGALCVQIVDAHDLRRPHD